MAVARKEAVRKAFKKGLIVLHPSSSTYFLFGELLGRKPPTDCWVFRVVGSKGLCIEIGSRFPSKLISSSREIPATREPREFDRSWVIKKGELLLGRKLKEILRKCS